MEDKSFITKEPINDRCLRLIISNKQHTKKPTKGAVIHLESELASLSNIYREMSLAFKVLNNISNKSARKNLILAWQKESKSLFW